MNEAHPQGRSDKIPGERIGAGPVVMELVEAMVGAAAGAITGSIAGPVGAAVGAVVGGTACAAAGAVLHVDKREQREHDAELDRQIGVTSGTIGEQKLQHPPPSHGLYHADALGVGRAEVEPSEGPVQNVDAAE